MDALHDLIHALADAYRDDIFHAHKQTQALILMSFLITFGIVRYITHSIRAGRNSRVFHNLSTGGTHLHHLVPGIFLILISGYIGLSVHPGMARDIVAVFFGIGAALTLDEFALWLHLTDVYWSKEGRQSVDAVVIAATLVGLSILGFHFWVDVGSALARLVRAS